MTQSSLPSLLDTQLQLGETKVWEEGFTKFTKLLNSSPAHSVFFDMDGVLAAEVIGEGCTAVLITAFFDQLAQRRSGTFVKASAAHPILVTVYAIPTLRDCGFLGFLGPSNFFAPTDELQIPCGNHCASQVALHKARPLHHLNQRSTTTFGSYTPRGNR